MNRPLRLTWIVSASLATFGYVSVLQACPAANSGLIAWYPGDGDARDVARGNDGTEMNGVTYATGVHGEAFSLDGVDDYVTAASTTENDPTTSGTMVAWVSFSQVPSVAGHIMEIIGKGSSGNDFDLQADVDDHFRFYIKAGSHASSTTVIEPETWYHVVGAWDASGIRIYVNGVLEESNPVSVVRSATGQPLEIGNQPYFGPRVLGGLVDDVQIFDASLSDGAVADLYAGCGFCGDADANGSIKATDALIILRAAVGVASVCVPSRCDTDDSSSVLASDALRDLQFAVGLDVVLNCPPR